MNTLFYYKLYENGKFIKFIGYVNINGASLKIMTASCWSDFNYFVEREGFTRYIKREPQFPKYVMTKKDW